MLVNKIMDLALEFPDKTAVDTLNHTVTYEQLISHVKMRSMLYKNIFGSGPVGVILNSSLELVEIILAFALNNSPIVLLGNGLKKEEYRYYQSVLNLEYVIMSEKKCREYGMEETNEVAGLSEGLVTIRYRGGIPYNSEFLPGDFMIKITSGSQGVGKVGARTQESIVKEIVNTDAMMHFETDEVFLCNPPIFHSYGLIVGTLLPLYYGKTLVLLDEFYPDLVVDILSKKKINVLVAVPFMYHLICKRLEKEEGYSFSLTKCFSAGAVLEKQTYTRFKELTGVRINNDYGSTETGVICINDDMENHMEAVGRPVNGNNVIITDAEGRVLNLGETGQICIRSESIGRGYVHPVTLNKEKYQDGYYMTGDRGYIGEDGYIILKERLDDYLNIGGEKTSAREIQEVILKLGGVKEVVIVGQKDGVRGDIVIAYIKKEESIPLSVPEVLKHCRAYLSAYKVPKYIKFVENIPKNSNGKILKKYLMNEKGEYYV